ncbi:unnamed protein product, partial [marine sediment metagenome]
MNASPQIAPAGPDRLLHLAQRLDSFEGFAEVVAALQAG